jgi:hypothetical protein
MAVLRKAVRRRRIAWLVMAGALAFIATMMVRSPASGGDQVVKFVIFGVMVVAALVLGYGGSRAIDNDAVLRVLFDRPGDVVWIYVTRTSRFAGSANVRPLIGLNYFASHLKVGLAEGTLMALAVPLRRDDECAHAASILAPQATVGFDGAIEQRFRAAPASLRRAA